MRRFLLILSVLMLALPAWSQAYNDARVPGSLDRDGDGDADYVRVECDLVGPATCTLADLLAGIEAVADEGGDKTISVAPGDYVWDSAYDALHNAKGWTLGAIELDANTKLLCDPGATIYAPGTLNLTDELSAIAVSTDGVEVRGCTVNGNAGSSVYTYSSLGFTGSRRFGIYVEGGDDFVIADNVVTATYHSGIYVRHNDGGLIQGNHIKEVGGYWADDSGLTQPCVYLFATGTGDTRNITVADNRCEGSGAAAFNVRIDDFDDVIENILFSNNVATDIRNHAATPDYNVCLNLGGVRNVVVNGLVCSYAEAALQLTTGDTWLDEAVVANSLFPNKGVSISNVTASNLQSTAAWGMQFGDYQQAVTVSNVLIQDTPSGRDCVGISGIQRGLVLDGLTLSRCGGHGIRFLSASSTDPADRVILRNITILDADAGTPTSGGYDGINLPWAAANLTFENIIIHGFSASAVRVTAGIDNSVFRNFEIDMTRTRFLGTMSEATANGQTCDAAAEGDTLITLDANNSGDCSFAAGTGTSENGCYCDGASWVDWHVAGADHGIRIFNGTSSENVFENVVCKNLVGGHFNCIDIDANGTNNIITNITGMNTIGTATATGSYTFESAVDINGGSATTTNINCVNRYTGGTDGCNQI
jgi:hypothetical protein